LQEKKRTTMSAKTILVVDDDPEVRLALGIRLEDKEFEVIFAEDGVESIFMARMHMPDMILLDLGLPAGDGFSVLEMLRSNDHLCPIPVIILSGRDRFANRERALTLGAKAFLQKPVDSNQLLAVMRQVFEQKDQTTRLVYDLGLCEPAAGLEQAPPR
jgi:DNA-binding response OmpR family regulator